MEIVAFGRPVTATLCKGGMGETDLLDFARLDIRAARDNHILRAVLQGKITCNNTTEVNVAMIRDFHYVRSVGVSGAHSYIGGVALGKRH